MLFSDSVGAGWRFHLTFTCPNTDGPLPWANCPEPESHYQPNFQPLPLLCLPAEFILQSANSRPASLPVFQALWPTWLPRELVQCVHIHPIITVSLWLGWSSGLSMLPTWAYIKIVLALQCGWFTLGHLFLFPFPWLSKKINLTRIFFLNNIFSLNKSNHHFPGSGFQI